MTGVKDYIPDKPPFFEDLKPYVGFLKPELIKCFRYYAYRCYGKNWRKGREFHSMNYLIRSIELNKNHPDKFAWDIKEHKRYYRSALEHLFVLISESRPHQSDDYSLDLITRFCQDLEVAVNTVVRSKSKFVFKR